MPVQLMYYTGCVRMSGVVRGASLCKERCHAELSTVTPTATIILSIRFWSRCTARTISSLHATGLGAA